MTIVDARPAVGSAVFEGRQRVVAATFLVLGPAVMLVAFLFAALAERSAPGQEDLGVAVKAPTAAALGTIGDLLTVPSMLAFVVVILLITRPWSAKVAWSGAVAMVLQLGALGALVGMELVTAVLAQQGVPVATVQHGMDSVASNPAGVVLEILFFPTEIVGLILVGIALWRTRWVPRFVPIFLWLFPVLDMATPNHPKILHVIAFAVFLTAFSFLAALVLRNGAPRPVPAGHTVGAWGDASGHWPRRSSPGPQPRSHSRRSSSPP